VFSEVDALAFIIKEAMRVFRPSDSLDLDTMRKIRRERKKKGTKQKVGFLTLERPLIRV